MKNPGNKIINILILCIIIAGAWIRVNTYGDLTLSIGMLDTESYIDSSATTTSWTNAFTGRRLFTTNILYKLVGNEESCKITTSSNPDMGEEGMRAIQPCFNRIVLLQNILSIFGWCLLAWVTAGYIKFAPYKIIITILILAFGFTPQIAEWDSILSSESLSLSLYPIVLALLMIIVFRLSDLQENNQNFIINILILWLGVFSFWLFIRDAHIYAALTTLALTVPLLLFRKYRQMRILSAAVIFLLVLFIAGNYSSKFSPRWQPSLTHVLDYYILPYPARVDFFSRQGMPGNFESAEYAAWFEEEGIKTYGLFLISHPGFIISNTLDISSYLKSDFIQPHFKSFDNPNRSVLLILGEAVHPETNAIYLTDLLLVLSLTVMAIKQRGKATIAWSWLAAWVFIYAVISLFISLFGDIDGTRRHIFPSVELFRLFLWIFLTVQIDLAIDKKRTEITTP